MIRRNYARLIVLFLGIHTSFALLHACMTTFINDSNSVVTILNHLDNEIILIQKNKSRRFGDPHQHAHFSVYVPQSSHQVFKKVYECKQNECGKNGNPEVKFSYLERYTQGERPGETYLFTIKKSDNRLSMVQRVIKKQKECPSCAMNQE